MPSQKNIGIVKSLTDKIKSSKSLVFMNYRGTNANATSAARKVVKGSSSEYLIAKNRLFKIALKNVGIVSEEIDDMLKGPTSFIISYDENELAPKVTKEFSKRSDLFQIKGGMVYGKTISYEKVIFIANLPSKEVLISQLLSVLNPIQKLHTVLTATIKKLSQPNESSEKESD